MEVCNHPDSRCPDWKQILIGRTLRGLKGRERERRISAEEAADPSHQLEGLGSALRFSSGFEAEP
jgi:hypothetical protein